MCEMNLWSWSALIVEEEFLLLHETLQVILDRVAGIHLPELRQEQVTKGWPRS
jgi:hypothetical protein